MVGSYGLVGAAFLVDRGSPARFQSRTDAREKSHEVMFFATSARRTPCDGGAFAGTRCAEAAVMRRHSTELLPFHSRPRDGRRPRSTRLIALLALVAGACVPSRGRAGEPHPAAGVAARDSDATGLEGLSWPDRLGLERAMAALEPRFAPGGDGALELEGAQGVDLQFSARGAEAHVGDRTLAIRASAVGRPGALEALVDGTPEVHGPEVQRNRGAGVIEWWRSLPSGLEHGVTLAERPRGDGQLEVHVEVSGLLARAESSDRALLIDGRGTTVARYEHLVAWDADGARVPGRIEVHAGAVVLAVDDERARYPLVVDPLLVTLEATLESPDLLPDCARGCADDALPRFGASVALSADGSRALVGAPWGSSALSGAVVPGFARVFARTGSTWALEATLTASEGEARFGASVSLSADGSLALVGAPDGPGSGGVRTGSAHVFVRSGTVWAGEGTLLPREGRAGEHFGASVALSSDGTRAVVGAPGSWIAYSGPYDPLPGFCTRGPMPGSARVFVRDGSGWTEEARLAGPGLAPFAECDAFGHAVAIDADGTRVLVGAPADDAPVSDFRGSIPGGGTARVFVREGSSWRLETMLLHPLTETAFHGELARGRGECFGSAVALSSDAARALVSAPRFLSPRGQAVVFARTEAAWTTEAELTSYLYPSGVTPTLGAAVALSSDGRLALVGDPWGHDPRTGRGDGNVRVYSRSGESWSEDQVVGPLESEPRVWSAFFGAALAMSRDGGWWLVGGPQGGEGRGGYARVLTTGGSPAGLDAGAADAGLDVDGGSSAPDARSSLDAGSAERVDAARESLDGGVARQDAAQRSDADVSRPDAAALAPDAAALAPDAAASVPDAGVAAEAPRPSGCGCRAAARTDASAWLALGLALAAVAFSRGRAPSLRPRGERPAVCRAPQARSDDRGFRGTPSAAEQTTPTEPALRVAALGRRSQR
jgi:hypothetical protein